jgi:polyphosphate kinase
MPNPDTPPSPPKRRPRRAAKAAAPVAPAALDLSGPELYLNRELTWLQFNRRVLHEAQDPRTPLLERVKFLAITGSNLDEFFMKRIGGLKQQVGAGVQLPTADGRTPQQQIDQCYAQIRELQGEKQQLSFQLMDLLRGEGIEVLGYEELTAAEKTRVRTEYYQKTYPLVTPQSIDPAHPFPFISNLSLNLLVALRYPGATEQALARVKIPISAGTPRFLRVGKGDRFVLLEDVMANNLDMLFPEMEILSCEPFRVTRNANTEQNEEHADDLLAMIESELKDRRFAPIVRLEVKPGMEPARRGRLAAELGLDEEADVFDVEGMLGARDLMEIAALNYPHLKDPPHHPVDHPALPKDRSIFHIVREHGDILLQHPYEAFATSVERFLREASRDPKVLAIKMILYRTSSRSPILEHLVRAAQNGKQVAVVVELKARFDEQANIILASRMEEAGIHVTYGVVGLKTHSKVVLVVRQDYDGLRRYLHIGTGNYHPETSRIYSDLGLLTCDPALGADATELFNYLTTGFTPKRNYQKLLVAPKSLKKALLSRIQREAERHGADTPGHIQFKVNALEDQDITRALYQASRAGVRIELIVRDTCQLRPGVPGLSDNIRVISIVGRFLEHSRLYYFRNGGDEEYYIGSADTMKRNLEHRVEVVTPVEPPALRRQLRVILDTLWHDPRGAWEMQSDGGYLQRQPEDGKPARCSQEQLILLAEKRVKEAGRRKKSKKTKGPGGRNLR